MVVEMERKGQLKACCNKPIGLKDVVEYRRKRRILALSREALSTERMETGFPYTG